MISSRKSQSILKVLQQHPLSQEIQLKSTIHQVINPPKELWGTSRYSIPFFMHPISEMPLNCLENCVDSENPKGFEDTTAGDFLHERLIELGLIKK